MPIRGFFQGKGKINTKTTNKDLLGVKILNTENINGKINGMPFLPYENFIKNPKQNLDLWMFYTIFERIFNKIFEWEGLKLKEKRLLEKLLFKNGEAVIVKIEGSENLFISAFSYIDKNVDIFNYPKTIKIISPGSSLDNKTLNKNFIIIKNNLQSIGTIYPIWNRFMNLLTALRKMDKINYTSDVKVLLNMEAGDDENIELNNSWYTDNVFLKMPGAFLQDTKIEPIQLAGNAKEKVELFLDQLNMVLSYLGFNTSDLVKKAERQSQMEISNNSDKFNGLLFEEMLEAREECIEEDSLGLGLSVSLNEKVIDEVKEEINQTLGKKDNNNEY